MNNGTGKMPWDNIIDDSRYRTNKVRRVVTRVRIIADSDAINDPVLSDPAFIERVNKKYNALIKAGKISPPSHKEL